MKKVMKYLPSFLYIFAFLSFLIPSIYINVANTKFTFNFFELIKGKDMFDFSIGLLLVLILFLATIILSIATLTNDNNLLTNTTIILGLSSGILTFFQRLLTNPNSTNCSVFIGLILPGVLILLGTLILFINKKLMK